MTDQVLTVISLCAVCVFFVLPCLENVSWRLQQAQQAAGLEEEDQARRSLSPSDTEEQTEEKLRRANDVRRSKAKHRRASVDVGGDENESDAMSALEVCSTVCPQLFALNCSSSTVRPQLFALN